MPKYIFILKNRGKGKMRNIEIKNPSNKYMNKDFVNIFSFSGLWLFRIVGTLL